MKQRPLNVTHWPDRFRQWMDEQGFLKPLPPPGTPAAAARAHRHAAGGRASGGDPAQGGHAG